MYVASPYSQVGAQTCVRACVCTHAHTPVLLAIYFSEWVAKQSYASRVRACVHFCGCVRVCVCPFPLAVRALLCVGPRSMCVWVRGEVSLGWPWLESWRRAEVKQEICRKDTHHFPHYYFFFLSLRHRRVSVLPAARSPPTSPASTSRPPYLPPNP